MSVQPDYVSFEPNAREELLTQVGSFSPLERTLFQRLCESWAPVIDRNRFLSGVGGSEQEISSLDRLMTKLRSAQLGLVTTGIVAEKRVPVGLVLTGKADLWFFMNLLEEETRKLLESGYRILPSEARLAQRKAVPPDYHITDANSVMLAEAHLADSPEDGILRIRLLGEYRIIVSSRSVRDLIKAAIEWLRISLDERGFVDEVARVKNVGIIELKKQLSEQAPEFWMDLSRTLVQERSTIAFRKNIQEDDELFQSAFLVMNFTEAQIGAIKARQENDNRVEEELENLAEMVEQTPGGRMLPEDFELLLREAEARLKREAAVFTKRVENETLSPKPRRKLPVVAKVAGSYIHRNRVRGVFEAARVLVSERLRQEFTELLEAFLRGRSPETGEIFASKIDLDQNLRDRAERLDPLLGELMKRPQLLAEAVIRDAKLKNEDITAVEIKVILTGYFNVANSELRPSSELFELDLVGMYDAAHAKLNVFRQLMLRFSGRHESLRRSYVRRFGPPRPKVSYADDGDGGAPGGGRTRAEPQAVPGIRVRGSGNRDSKSETADQQSGRPGPSLPPKPRIRPPHEVDRAWRDFHEAIHIKKTSGADEIDEFGDGPDREPEPDNEPEGPEGEAAEDSQD